MKAPKILFFVDGMAPSPEDLIAASEITGQVCFRNARAVPSEGALEACDGVAGHVPAPYKDQPTAAEAIEKHAAAVKALAAKVGDSPAPVTPVKTDDAKTDASAATGAQEGAGAGDAAQADALTAAPGAAPAGAAGTAWKAN